MSDHWVGLRRALERRPVGGGSHVWGQVTAPPTCQPCMAVPETAAKDEGHVVPVVRLHEAGPAVPVHVGPVHKLVQVNWDTGIWRGSVEGGQRSTFVSTGIFFWAGGASSAQELFWLIRSHKGLWT